MPYVHFKTFDGVHYLCGENGGGGYVNATRVWAAQWETFRLIAAQGGAPKSETPVNLCTYDGTHYVCAENGGGGEINATRQAAQQWETFQIHRVDGQAEISPGCSVNIRTYDGHYVCAENGGGGEVNATRQAAQQWETFTIELVPLSFPLHVDGSKEVAGGEFVGATASLSDAGRLDCELHVWTRNRTYGFHGAASVFVVDEGNQILWNTQLHTLGVDGLWIPGLPSSRVDNWSESVPGNVMPKVGALRIALVTNPTNMLMRDINILADVGKKVGEIAAVVSAIL